MTINDLFDTPLNEIWDIIDIVAIPYLIFVLLMVILVFAIIIFSTITIYKTRKEMRMKRVEIRNKRRW